MKPLPALRYLAALLVTLCILPAWARVYVTPMVFGAVEPLYLGMLLAGLAVAMLLTWRLHPKMTGQRWVHWAPLAVIVGWVVVLGITATLLVLPVPGMAAMMSLFFLGTLWLPSTVWLFYRGTPSRPRI